MHYAYHPRYLAPASDTTENQSGSQAKQTHPIQACECAAGKTQGHSDWINCILDALSSHIAVLDKEGSILAVNQAWVRFSVAANSPTDRCGIGTNYLEITEASAREGDAIAHQAYTGIRGVLHGELPAFSLEYPCHSPERQNWFLMQVSPLPNGQGCVVAHLDITARKLAEDAQMRLAAILSATSDFVGMANTHGEVLYANEALRQMVETHDKSLRHITDCHPVWAARSIFSEGIPAAIQNGSWSGETALLTADGHEVPVHQVILSHMDVEGKPAYLSTIMRDISQVKRREKDLRQTIEQMEWLQGRALHSETMASIGQLAAGMAHEINNPVSYVYSNLGHLGKYTHDLLTVISAFEAVEHSIPSAEGKAALAALKQEIDLDFLRQDVPILLTESQEGLERVRKIVLDLRDFSRSGEHDTWEWFDLRHGLERTLNIVGNELKFKAEVRREFGDIPEILCLPGQINQVFLNMLVNAAHAIETNGVITIRTWTEGGQICVEIADTGCGIPPEDQGRIFEPFFTTKPVGKGTGLGLSISYGIVQKHGGNIQVESTQGKGTSFRIMLPISGPKCVVGTLPSQ